MSSTKKSPLPKKSSSRPGRAPGAAYLGSEIAEPSTPAYRDDQDSVRLFGELVDAIGANLDRSASALARIEAKLARA